jgi:hypothetical protein
MNTKESCLGMVNGMGKEKEKDMGVKRKEVYTT